MLHTSIVLIKWRREIHQRMYHAAHNALDGCSFECQPVHSDSSSSLHYEPPYILLICIEAFYDLLPTWSYTNATCVVVPLCLSIGFRVSGHHQIKVNAKCMCRSNFPSNANKFNKVNNWLVYIVACAGNPYIDQY